MAAPGEAKNLATRLPLNLPMSRQPFEADPAGLLSA
jgi:hypothetical protein